MFKKTKTGEGAVAEIEIPAEGPGVAEGGSSLRRLARAVSLHMRGEREEALKVLEGAEVDADANELAEITAARGHIQLELNRHEDAAASYARLAKIPPDSAAIPFSLALCLQNLRRYSEAVANFRASHPLARTRL